MKICSNGPAHITKMAAMPIYGINPLKIFFSETSMPVTFEHGIQHQGLEPIKFCSNDDPGLTLTYFTARLTLLPISFLWEYSLILVFIETIEVFELKVGTNSCLSEYMNTYEYQRSKSFVYQSDLYFQASAVKFAGHIKVKFHVEPSWSGVQNLFEWCRSHDHDDRHAHIWLNL